METSFSKLCAPFSNKYIDLLSLCCVFNLLKVVGASKDWAILVISNIENKR